MWANFSGRALTRPQFDARIAELRWTEWRPRGITLHNTAAPNLKQWAESGPAHDARIRNLQSYYENEMGWHAGPHWFISRNFFNEFSNPLRPGVHSRCYNATHIGIEMVGDYNVEEFNSGDGAMVRDNAVHAAAVFCRKFGFDPDDDITFHKECKRDNHDCPGHKVVKADVIARIKAEMARLGGDAPKPAAPAAPGPARRTQITATVFTDEQGAYGPVDVSEHGVSLPWSFVGERPMVTVYGPRGSVTAPVVDKGPWNWTDKEYVLFGARPRVERTAQKADNGQVPTNKAGIDLLPETARAVGISGKGLVDWEFASKVAITETATPTVVIADADKGMAQSEPAPEPIQADVAPAPRGLWGMLSKVGAIFTGGAAALFYDWRVVAILAFAIAVAIALFVDVGHIRRLINNALDSMLKGSKE